jgi:hypothetical protein
MTLGSVRRVLLIRWKGLGKRPTGGSPRAGGCRLPDTPCADASPGGGPSAAPAALAVFCHGKRRDATVHAPPSYDRFATSFALSRTAAIAPTTMFPGGVFGARGCGRVGAAFLAERRSRPSCNSSSRLAAWRSCASSPPDCSSSRTCSDTSSMRERIFSSSAGLLPGSSCRVDQHRTVRLPWTRTRLNQ